MRKSLVFLAALALPAFAAEIKLFNGKNLDGWKRLARHESQPDHAPGFKIENGLLITDFDAPEDDIWYPKEPTDEEKRFGMVIVKAMEDMPKPVTLAAVKAEPKLKDMVLVHEPRLSVQVVSESEWRFIRKMGGMKS